MLEVTVEASNYSTSQKAKEVLEGAAYIAPCCLQRLIPNQHLVTDLVLLKFLSEAVQECLKHIILPTIDENQHLQGLLTSTAIKTPFDETTCS